MSDKPALQFVDTNILVYAHDASAGEKHLHARSLVAGLWDSRKGCLSTQVLQEFYVTLTRKVPHPLDSETASQLVADLGQWTIHSPTVDDILHAIELQRRYDLAFWDAMIVASAAQLGCEQIWSEDLNTGQVYAGVRVVNPLVDNIE